MEKGIDEVAHHPSEWFDEETSDLELGGVQQYFGIRFLHQAENNEVKGHRVGQQNEHHSAGDAEVKFVHVVEVARHELVQLQEGVEGELLHVGLQDHDGQGPPDTDSGEQDVEFSEEDYFVFEDEEQEPQDVQPHK